MNGIYNDLMDLYKKQLNDPCYIVKMPYCYVCLNTIYAGEWIEIDNIGKRHLYCRE